MSTVNKISGRTLSYCRSKIGRDIYQYFHKNEKHRKEFEKWYLKTYGKKYKFRRLTVSDNKIQEQTPKASQIPI